MTAADILRERARLFDANQSMTMRGISAEWRAVADLMDGCVKHWPSGQWRCLVCGGSNPWPHHVGCPLAALERLITGKKDA